jgi:hypothetical protein
VIKIINKAGVASWHREILRCFLSNSVTVHEVMFVDYI